MSAELFSIRRSEISMMATGSTILTYYRIFTNTNVLHLHFYCDVFCQEPTKHEIFRLRKAITLDTSSAGTMRISLNIQCSLANWIQWIFIHTPCTLEFDLCNTSTIVYFPLAGERIITYMFVRYRLKWDALKFSFYSTYSVITHSLGKIASYNE